MGYSIILPLLELSLLDLRDSTVLGISDLSTYSSTPDSTHLAMQITPVGYPTINVPFTPLNVNVYKCVDLGITCSDTGCTPLNDGIWDIVYTVLDLNGVPTTIEKKFIKIDQIRCKYQNTFLKIDLECICGNSNQEKYLKEIKRAKLFIDGSVAACNDSNYVLSFELYQKAEYILDHICSRFNIPYHSCGFVKPCFIC